MALQLTRLPSSPAYLNATTYAIGQAGPVYAWHIDKNVAEPVAVAMLPVLTGLIAQRGLLMLVCDASIDAPALKSFAAASAAQAILRSYYYKVEPSNYSHMLFQAMLEGIREANTEIANHFWPDSDQPTQLALTDNLAGISATAVVAYDNKLVVGTVGSTCAYRIRNGKLAMYEQGEQERLIVLKDDFRKDDRVFICTNALADVNGAGRIRAAARTSITTSPEAIRTLIEDAEQVDATEIVAAAMLYRNTATPALLTTSRAAAPTPASKMMRWLTLASILVILGVGVWLVLENRRTRSDAPPNLTAVAPGVPAAAEVAPQVPTTTGLMSVPIMESKDSAAAASLSTTGNLSVVITTSEAGIVVFQLAATETPAPLPTAVAVPTLTAAPTARSLPAPTRTPAPTLNATATQTRTVVRPTATTKPVATQAPQPTSPPPQPTSLPPQPTSPPPQPTSPPPQPTSPPPQPTSPPPQPTSPPPQPTSPPPQPTSPPPQPTSPPPQPTPDLVLPCLPGDTQCKP